ncbi:Uncharacterized protein FKW44_014587 [Caligus rogercresseyi]|uniref:Uncharacterized protein n=1 Tax=Caligus rogercresseyi TaxID=217165 RepID=A0A7T8GZ62_CALRO|nr:Uncharacterized protein FKW44_014587 [Caligus rogercresseyi]
MAKVLAGLQAVEEQIRRGLRFFWESQGGGEGGSHKVHSKTGSDHGCGYFYRVKGFEIWPEPNILCQEAQASFN